MSAPDFTKQPANDTETEDKREDPTPRPMRPFPTVRMVAEKDIWNVPGGINVSGDFHG